MPLPEKVEGIIQKATERYYIRPYHPKDYEVVRNIFIEGMMEYSPQGRNVRRTYKALDEEHAQYLKEAEAHWAGAYERYVAYNLKDANMSRIEEYWSLSRRSAFLCCVDRETEQVIGTVAVQPVEICGMSDYYCSKSILHSRKLQELGYNYMDERAKALNVHPTHLYSLDNPLYQPSTYVSKPTIMPSTEPQHLTTPANILTKKEDIDAALIAYHEQEGTDNTVVPEGFYKRFQPQKDFFMVPFPQGMSESTYTQLVPKLLDEQTYKYMPKIVESVKNNTYDYYTSLQCEDDLPSLPSYHNEYQECEFRRMSVTYSHRGTGAAQLLLFTALHVAANVFKFDSLHLSTSQTMDMAIITYKKLGFRYVDANMDFNIDSKYPFGIAHFKYDFTQRGVDNNVLKYHSANVE